MNQLLVKKCNYELFISKLICSFLALIIRTILFAKFKPIQKLQGFGETNDSLQSPGVGATRFRRIGAGVRIDFGFGFGSGFGLASVSAIFRSVKLHFGDISLRLNLMSGCYENSPK